MKYSIFVCAHKVRDGRCGYCGPAIIDLINQELVKKGGEGKVEVFPCSHVGGHAYAGNVLVYGSKGGVCYGCFCPSDVEALVDSMLSEVHTGGAPTDLVGKVRGYLTHIPVVAATEGDAEKKVETPASPDTPTTPSA